MKTFFSAVLLTAVFAFAAGNSFAGFIPVGGRSCPPEQSNCQPPSSETSESISSQPETDDGGAVVNAIYTGLADALDFII